MRLGLPAIDAVSLVMVGDLNPAIFHPAWFVAEGLMDKQDADSAQVSVVTPMFSQFEMRWLQLSAQKERLTLISPEEPFERLRDLTIQMFSILRHTPLRQLGINRLQHYKLSDASYWRGLSDRLIPSKKLQFSEAPLELRLFAFAEETPSEPGGGKLTLQIEPSTLHVPGIFVQCNDHHENRTATIAPSAPLLMELLAAHWASSLEKSRTAINRLKELVP